MVGMPGATAVSVLAPKWLAKTVDAVTADAVTDEAPELEPS